MKSCSNGTAYVIEAGGCTPRKYGVCLNDGDLDISGHHDTFEIFYIGIRFSLDAGHPTIPGS